MVQSAFRVLFFTGLAAVGLAQFHCTNNHSENNTYLNHHDTVKYVGMSTCQSCHYQIHQTFTQTGMGLSFDTAHQAKSIAVTGPEHIVYDSFSGYYYQPFWQDGKLKIREFRFIGKNQYQRIETIDYIVGSGQHTQSNLINTNGYLTQAPITWYAQKGRWDMAPGFEGGHNSRFDRIIGLECMSCHNALPGFDAQSENRYTKIHDGIDCERCHGPGEAHVKLKMAGEYIDTSRLIDYSIVNPRKLSWELQIDLCQRCHLQGNAVLKEGKTFFSFRPGMKLKDVMDVYLPRYEGNDEEFIMASHAERLQMSRCFTQSGGGQSKKITCITCHNPHVSVKATGRQVYNTACLQCHQSETDCKTPSSDRLAAGNNCVQCHMQVSGTTDIPHVTVHDHYIRANRNDTTAKEKKKFIGLYAVNNATPDALSKTKAYLNWYEKFDRQNARHLDSAKYYLKKSGTPDALKVQWLYLKNDFKTLTEFAASLKPDKQDAWTAYRTGQAVYEIQGAKAAMPWYRRAVEQMPMQLDFREKYAACLIETGQNEAARTELERILSLHPKRKGALTNMGLLALNERKIPEADRYLRQALALDPQHTPALVNLYHIARLTGQKLEEERLSRILGLKESKINGE